MVNIAYIHAKDEEYSVALESKTNNDFFESCIEDMNLLQKRYENNKKPDIHGHMLAAPAGRCAGHGPEAAGEGRGQGNEETRAIHRECARKRDGKRAV